MWPEYCTVNLSSYCTFGYILRHVLTTLTSEIILLNCLFLQMRLFCVLKRWERGK